MKDTAKSNNIFRLSSDNISFSKYLDNNQYSLSQYTTRSSKSENNQKYNDILDLQETAGNQAVMKYINSDRIQAKLKISQPSDEYEQEADRVVEQVMRISERSDSVARIAIPGDKRIGRKCNTCEMKEKEENEKLNISRKPSTHSSNVEANDQVTDEINGIRTTSGSSLDSSTKEFMETRFGYDFSNVKIHSDEIAARSTSLVNALAYTIGNDIVFGQGQYQPDAVRGRRLLAHELTHVVQQSQTAPSQLQRQPAAGSQIANDDQSLAEELDNEVQGWESLADQDADLMLRARAARMVLLLKWRSRPPLRTPEEKDKFTNECDKLSLTELDTLNAFSPEGAESYLAFYPKGFPLTWSARVRAALTLGVDVADIISEWWEALKELSGLAGSLISPIYKKGLPVPMSKIHLLDNYRLLYALSAKGSEVQNYARESLRYLKIRSMAAAAFAWENIVTQIATDIADGKTVANYWDWKDFVDNKQAILRDLPARARTLPKSEEEAQQFQNDAISLKDAALLAGTGAGLAAIFGGMFTGWTEAQALFDGILAVVDNLVANCPDIVRLITALEWAGENDYFSEAISAWAHNLIEQGTEILKEIAVIVILQFIPGVNVAVDVYLAITLANDVITLLDELGSSLQQVMNADSVSKLHRAAARLAEVLTNGGMQVLITLATFGIGKAAARLRKRAGELRAADKTLTAEAAEKRAMREMSAAERKPLEEASGVVEQFERRYTPETKDILDTPGVRSRLASISEEARKLIELCDSPCLPPAHQLLEADLKLLERIQKRLGRPGEDRGLREYFYKRRRASGGLKKAIEDLDQVKKADLQSFLDTEIIKRAPPGTTLSRNAQGRFVLERGPGAPKGTAPKVTEYDIRPYGQHDPFTEGLNHFFESHHGIQDAWAMETAVPGYSREAAPGILLRDSRASSPHETISLRQRRRDAGRASRTYVDERSLMIEDLRKADVPRSVIDRTIAANDKYFGDLYKDAMRNGYTKKGLERWFGTWKPPK